LERYLESLTLTAPAVPVIHNADVASYRDPALIKAALARQLFSPVRWVETIRRFAGEGVSHVAECGPGKVLAGLNKRIDNALQMSALVDADAMIQARSAMAG
jgi:[acyl-carrier-protein] S-malonyltransferase